MFLSKSSHKAVVAAKDETIYHLRSEIAFLRRLVQPSGYHNVSLEADLAIGGHENQVQTPSEDPKKLAIDSEAARLLSGTY